jgi:hypothetical protein
LSAPRPNSPLPMAPRLRPSQEAPHMAQIYDTRNYQRARRQPSLSRSPRKSNIILLTQMFGLGALFMISFGYFSNSEFRQTVNGAVTSVLPASPATSGTADVQRSTAEIDPFAPADTVVLQERESLPIIKLDDAPPVASPPPVAEALEPPPAPVVLKAPEPAPVPEIVKVPEPVPAPEIVKAPEPVPEPLVAEAPEPSPESAIAAAPEPVPEPVIEEAAEPVPAPAVQAEAAPPPALPQPAVKQEVPAPAAEEDAVVADAGSSTSAADPVAIVESPKIPSKPLVPGSSAGAPAPQRTQGEAFSDCPNCPELVAVVATPNQGTIKPVNADFSGISQVQPYAIGDHEITLMIGTAAWRKVAVRNNLQTKVGAEDKDPSLGYLLMTLMSNICRGYRASRSMPTGCPLKQNGKWLLAAAHCPGRTGPIRLAMMKHSFAIMAIHRICPPKRLIRIGREPPAMTASQQQRPLAH